MSGARIAFTEPASDPPGIDGRYGPPAKPVEQTGLDEAFGIRIIGFPRQPSSGDADRDRMTPEVLKGLGEGSRRACAGPPGPLRDVPDEFKRTGARLFYKRPPWIELPNWAAL
jgi:hypothetical protein